MTEARRGQAPGQLSRAEFGARYQSSFRDPAFAAEKEALGRIEQIAWLAFDWMGLVDAGQPALLDRFIGYYEPYATSHECLDRDLPVQQEARNVARAVAHAVKELRTGTLAAVQPRLERPRPK